MIKEKIKILKKVSLLTIASTLIFSLYGCVDYSDGATMDSEKTEVVSENVKESVKNDTIIDTANDTAKDNKEDSENIEQEDSNNSKNEEESIGDEMKMGNLVNTDKISPVIIATSPATVDICLQLEIPLAGIPHSDTFAISERYKGAMEIGTAMAPDMELVASLNPDWILSPVSLISDLQPKYDAIDTEYAFLNLSSVPGMYKSIEELGEIFDRKEQADKLIREFEVFYDKYRKEQEEKEAPSVLILMGLPGSYVVATPSSYVGNLVELAGGKNVYGEETEGFINVNTEDILEKDPDIILRTAHALPDSVMEMFAEEFETNDIWKHFTAVKNERVYDLDYKLFPMSANLQYKEALENLNKIFYGDETGIDESEKDESFE